jgi:hypothetical protein
LALACPYLLARSQQRVAVVVEGLPTTKSSPAAAPGRSLQASPRFMWNAWVVVVVVGLAAVVQRPPSAPVVVVDRLASSRLDGCRHLLQAARKRSPWEPVVRVVLPEQQTTQVAFLVQAVALLLLEVLLFRLPAITAMAVQHRPVLGDPCLLLVAAKAACMVPVALAPARLEDLAPLAPVLLLGREVVPLEVA